MTSPALKPSPSKWIFLSVVTIFLGYSVSSFNQSQLHHSLPAPKSDLIPNLEQVSSPTAFFYTKVYGSLEKTFISVPFSFSADPQPIWVYLAMQEGTPRIGRLAYQPQLANLDWSSVKNDQVTLYQKTPKYSSINDFLDNPPEASLIIMDPYLSVVDPYQKIPGDHIPAESPIDTDIYAYILTTFKPPRKEQDVYYFESTLNAKDADISEDQELSWLIQAPQASINNPYLLGQIRVDYR